MLLGPDPSADQVVPHCVSEGIIVVPCSGHIPILDQGVVEVTVEGTLHILDVLDQCDLLSRRSGSISPGQCVEGPTSFALELHAESDSVPSSCRDEPFFRLTVRVAFFIISPRQEVVASSSEETDFFSQHALKDLGHIWGHKISG
ncbi:hypothetical protein TNIN_392681 [Trichonephila inaurata madagascariensis]|uniref:Uncharacterized protein n=1 Tax=Trichonephila inaurata madagascariensis TaxID=2747483 RepID=A0A8X6YG50_9ARAC|nr:hypothetical protein TNIN_392681 [Trichonephila inaurata madagascariensis]